jgi:hypothetical protein
MPPSLNVASLAQRGGSVFDAASGGFLSFSNDPHLVSLSPAKLFVGLKNTDDEGTRFDLNAEVLVNGSVVSSGLTRCVVGVTRNPIKAIEVTVAFDAFDGVLVGPDDVLTLRVLTRIGTNADNTKCAGHGSARGLRLYYDAAGRPSQVNAKITPNPSQDLFLRSDGGACKDAPSAGVTIRFLDDTDPIAPAAKCKDSAAINFSGGNPWQEIGAWNLV